MQSLGGAAGVPNAGNVNAVGLQQANISYSNGFFRLPNGNEYRVTSLNGQPIHPGGSLTDDQVKGIIQLFSDMMQKASKDVQEEVGKKDLSHLNFSKDASKSSYQIQTTVGQVVKNHGIGRPMPPISSQQRPPVTHQAPHTSQAAGTSQGRAKDDFREYHLRLKYNKGMPVPLFGRVNYKKLVDEIKSADLSDSELKSLMTLNKDEEKLLDMITKYSNGEYLNDFPKLLKSKTLKSLMFKQTVLAARCKDPVIQKQAKDNLGECAVALQQAKSILIDIEYILERKEMANEFTLLMQNMLCDVNDFKSIYASLNAAIKG